MPLQNRVDPFGELIATTARGTLFGNRGGKFHRDDRTLSRRRYATRQWICCVLSFKGRQRNVWGRYYTELFFLDEVTALAAGHRPCFECRRGDANDFARMFAGGDVRASAPEMDDILHAERLDGRAKRSHRRKLDALPDGVVVRLNGDDAFAVKGKRLLRWTPSGYVDTRPRPKGLEVEMLTPPSIAKVLMRGYVPAWHDSAG
jgi:hypothetical protein